MTVKYLIKAKINPIKKTIHSEVNIQFNEIYKDTIEFYLHKNLKIEEIVDSNQEVKFEENFEEKPLPYLPESKRYILTSKIQGSSIKIKYNGVIDKIEDIEINQISEDFIELNVYSPWYPLLTTFPTVDYSATISGLESYKLLKANISDKIWNLNLTSNDCYVIGVKNYREQRLEANGMVIKFYSISENGHKIVNQIVKCTERIINFYIDKFGNKKIYNGFDILVAPRKNGGGYCRENLIVLADNDDYKEEELIKSLAHEIAHIWWNGADVTTWEDWLNESFAEYSAWLLIENLFGIEKYKDLIGLYEDRTKNCPAIMNMVRNDTNAYISRFKGALILHNFREKYGQNCIYQLMNILNKLEIKNTENLISEIKLAMGEEQANYIYNKLNE